MRGKRVHKRRNPSKNGITPACAGKTCKHTRLILLPQDHPRVCGENACVPREYRACVGSPPRVRGILNELRKYVAAMRITPACAGKTGCLLRAWPCCQDHPRVCGENWSRCHIPPTRSGLPPRVRGKLLNARRKLFNVKDHPRVCGENKRLRYQFIMRRGSPPRVRGKPAEQHEGFGRLRITPACAGKTFQLRYFPRVSRDHPRVCGENSCERK